MKTPRIRTWRRWAALAAALAALAVAAAFCVWRAARAAEAARQARVAQYARYGIASDGRADFHALPPMMPHRPAVAALGGDLFRDKRLCTPSGRTCLTCHPLNAGGVDGRMHGRVLTRPVQFAAVSEVFLHDGSASNLAAVVRRMVCDPHYGGGTNLNYAAAWIGSDLKFAYRYKKQFPEGVNATNAVAAVVEYLTSLVSGQGAFDRYLGGEISALTAEEARGFEVFKAQHCVSCHAGPALGGWKVSDGRKVAVLRGLSSRRRYMTDGLRDDLAAVLPFMPGGDLANPADRQALLAFLRAL